MNVAKCITSPQRGEAYFTCARCGKVNGFHRRGAVKRAKAWGKEHKAYCKGKTGESANG